MVRGGVEEGGRVKVCLINPPFLFPRPRDAVFSHCLGLRSLSAHLRARGHEVVFVDALFAGFQRVRREDGGFVVGLSPEETAARVPEDVELVGVSAPFSQSARAVHELLEVLADRLPAARMVLGGVYPAAQPESALRSRAHAIVVGEGETALARLAAGEDPQTIPGVHTQETRVDDRFTPAERVSDLDTLLPPDRDIPSFDSYLALSPRGARGRVASILTSRGCPYDCEYCSVHPVHGWGFRGRSAGHVLKEVGALVERHGVRALEIEDDNLTWDRDRAAEIFEGFVRLREGGAELTWRPPNGVRVDTIDGEMIDLMVRSGCTELVFGIEHGDPAMLARMGKNLDLEKAAAVVESSVKRGVPRVTLFYMVGYPGEDVRSFEIGLEYLRRVRSFGGAVNVSPNLVQPYPGTRLLDRCRAEGWRIDPAFEHPLERPGLMSTRRVVGITGPTLDLKEILRRRELVMRMFGPRWKSAAKRFVPARVLPYLRHSPSTTWRDL